jgi:hypothetical protein
MQLYNNPHCVNQIPHEPTTLTACICCYSSTILYKLVAKDMCFLIACKPVYTVHSKFLIKNYWSVDFTNEHFTKTQTLVMNMYKTVYYKTGVFGTQLIKKHRTVKSIIQTPQITITLKVMLYAKTINVFHI